MPVATISFYSKGIQLYQSHIFPAGISCSGIEPAAVAAAVSTGGGEVAAVEEKTSFNVILKAAGPNKLAIVKIVKELTGLGLKEAKDLVDTAPKLFEKQLIKQQWKN